jgi:hypothetical protein
MFDLLTVLSPDNELILVVLTSICCWNVLFEPGTDASKVLKLLFIFVLSVACLEI